MGIFSQKKRASHAQGTATPHEGAKRTKRLNLNALIAIALILVGLGVLLYPVVATNWNNRMQARAANEYSKLEKSAPPELLRTAFEQAQQYNADLGSITVNDAWSTTDDENSPEYQNYSRYLSELAETDAMGRIVIPSINSDLPIYHGTSEQSLSRGVGHLYGTDLPVGGVGDGEGRHSALSAHTGLQNATMWDNLVKVKKGAAFYIAAGGEKLKYEIHDISVVLPSDTSKLTRKSGQDLVTLITCTPYGSNTHRLLVTGHRVPMDPSEEDVFNHGGPKWQWWMWAIVAAAIVIILSLALWLRTMLKSGRSDE